eukprot:Phypoly_transcript_04285.p1 GENE.Phypoly_transcript_04285~~Phypoly_transcript_04285.p1  ORF type:complete len:257 (+),score=22.49 Phypoly_transcript_04285:93-773(+)
MEVTLHEVVPQVPPKRTNEGLDDIDFSPLKRRKCLDATQQSELDPIFTRIVGWLREQHTRGALPKTITKLSRAIAPMCRAVVQVDCTVVFYHLVFNRIVLIEQNMDGSVTYSANPEPVRGSFVGYVPDDAPNVPFSDDFIMALERSTAWVLSNRGLGYFKGPEGMLTALRQICKMKREVSPDHVVELLVRRGLIRVEGTEDILYGLEHTPFPATHHYAASFLENLQ